MTRAEKSSLTCPTCAVREMRKFYCSPQKFPPTFFVWRRRGRCLRLRQLPRRNEGSIRTWCRRAVCVFLHIWRRIPCCNGRNDKSHRNPYARISGSCLNSPEKFPPFEFMRYSQAYFVANQINPAAKFFITRRVVSSSISPQSQPLCHSSLP